MVPLLTGQPSTPVPTTCCGVTGGGGAAATLPTAGGSGAGGGGATGVGRALGRRRQDATLEHRVGSVRVGLQVEGGAAGGGSRGVGAANAGDQVEGEERSGVEIRAGRGPRGDVPEDGGNGDEADDGDVRDCP